MIFAAFAVAIGAVGTVPAPAQARTMISIEFDDAYADQWQLRPVLSRYGAPATFFVNSGFLGTRGHMSVNQLLALQGDGHEIGGHTRDHRNQPDLSPAEQTDDICGDYQVLRQMDLAVSDFAYPNGSYTAETAAIASSCGYRSARTAGGLTPPSLCVPKLKCRSAETVPPTNPMATVTVPLVSSKMRLRTLQRFVLDAGRRRRGWVQIVFHHVCNGCDARAVPVSYLTGLLAWLRSPRLAPTVRILRVDSVVALRARLAGRR